MVQYTYEIFLIYRWEIEVAKSFTWNKLLVQFLFIYTKRAILRHLKKFLQLFKDNGTMITTIPLTKCKILADGINISIKYKFICF
jgi:hypothetical protein